MSGWPGSESADFGNDDHIDHIFRQKIEAPLLDRIAELEAALRGLLHYADRFPDKPHVAVAHEIHVARAALKKS